MSKPANGAAPTTAATPASAPAGGQNTGGHKQATMTPPSKSNVIALPGMCLAESCKKKSEKANFCMEHFDWFKEGLITKEGRRPTDFDKKHFDYTRRLAKKKSA